MSFSFMTQGKEISKRALSTIERCYSKGYTPIEIKEMLEGRGYEISYSAIYARKPADSIKRRKHAEKDASEKKEKKRDYNFHDFKRRYYSDPKFRIAADKVVSRYKERPAARACKREQKLQEYLKELPGQRMRKGRKLNAVVRELLDWAFEGGCTPDEAQSVMADFGATIDKGIVVHFHSVYCKKHAPKRSENIEKPQGEPAPKPPPRPRRAPMPTSAPRPALSPEARRERQRDRQREYLKQKSDAQWRENRDTAPRYSLTEYGKDILNIDGMAAGMEEPSSTFLYMRVLEDGSLNEYEMVERLRNEGHYVQSHSRGWQLAKAKQKLEGLKRKGFVELQ